MIVIPYHNASVKQLIGEKVPVVPRFIVRYSLNSKNYLKEVKCAIAVLHGGRNVVIPHKHGIQLKETNDQIDLTIIEGFGHNNLSGST